MSEAASYTWVCSACGRSVPLRVARCHCGASREQAVASAAQEPAAGPDPRLAAPGWRGVWRTLPRDVRVLLVAATVLVGGGVAWLLASPPPSSLGPALLGHVDPPVSPPTPRPAFKLPWWK